MLDVIKEYLVSLGFQVNGQSLNQAQNAMNQAERMITRFAGSSVTQFAVAGAAVTTFVAAANLALAKFMGNLAEAELRSQMFARQMYTTADNAMAVTNSLQAMGRSLEELYLSPELIKQFQELRRQSFQMRPPDEYREQMKFIRSIGFEFTKLKLEITYAMQWIGYYLFKYLEGPLKNIKIGMKDLNDLIVKNMPLWTQKIAMVVSWVGRLGIALFKAGEVLYKLFTAIPTGLKIAGGAFMGFFTLLKMGPIGWIIAGLTTLLLLIDDFATYKRGGKSAFAGLWEGIDELKSKISGEGLFDKILVDSKALTDSLTELGNQIKILMGQIGELFNDLAKLMGFKDYKDLFEKSIITAFKNLSLIIESITNNIRGLTDLLKGDLGKAFGEWGKNKDVGKQMLKNIWDFIPSSTSGAGYVNPKAQKNSFNTNQTNTFNVYGNDPYSTAKLVSNNMDGINAGLVKGAYAT